MEAKKTISIGLKKAYFGDVPAAGGMPTEMKQLARTLKGTASFNTEPDTVQDFYCEEEPGAPVLSVATEAGLKQIKLNFMEWDNNVLISVFGGEESSDPEDVTIDGKTYSVKKYKAPRDMVQVEKSIRVVTHANAVIEIPRALITARFVWNLTRAEVAQIEITAKALAPIGDNDAPYNIYKLGEAKPANANPDIL